MATKTYLPRLVFLIRHVVKYIRKWSDGLQDHVTNEQFVCIQSLLTTLDDCLAILA